MPTTNCIRTDHDHEGQRCVDCGQKIYFDKWVNDYRHTNPNARPCFLIREKGTACETTPGHGNCDHYGTNRCVLDSDEMHPDDNKEN